MAVAFQVGVRATVSRATARAIDRMADLRPALRTAGNIMTRSFGRNFAAEGRPTKWAPLSPATIARRRQGRGRLGIKILQDTGRLRESTIGRGAGAADHVYDLSPRSLVIGTRLIYAATHQFGRRDWKIPARPFVLVQPEDEQAIGLAFERWVARQMRRSGF